MTRSPIPFDPERGEDALSGLEVGSGPVRALLRGIAGCSPYLSGLIQQEKLWLPDALESPEHAFDSIVRGTAEHAPDLLAPALRRDKRRIALLTALADCGGVWDLMQVTCALTRFADAVVDVGLRRLLQAEMARGKLPGFGPEDDPVTTGMVVLAMGKMGAGELNYSSDIDLICLFDESRFSPEDYHDARAVFIRVTRRLMRLLSDPTSEGYVFRTDLRLRPDPSVTPVCLSMDAAERYYESLGRTWERAAYIKARPCGGDIAAGQAFLERLRPFVWRKHLDFAAIEDAHDMRLRIRDHKGLHGPITLNGHNVKLGRGGIREIEFFTQTRQLIAGGRDKSLRERRTLDALPKLASKDWVTEDLSDRLSDHYCHLREVEHRLQMINDAQTHTLPNNPEGFERLARFLGQSDTEKMRSALLDRLQEVHELTEGFFAPTVANEPPKLPDASRAVISHWPSYPALRSARAVEIFNRLKPDILRRLQKAARPEEALAQFDRFLAGLPAGVQLFSLFQANPQLIDLILDIVTTAPALANHLARNAHVLDAVLAGDFFAEWPGCGALERALGAVLTAMPDYESQLDAARRWAKEWHFRIGVHHLRGLIDAPEAGRQYAELASAALSALWPVVGAEFSRKHGILPGGSAVVLGMGSLGAGRLNARSDLDLIVIYDARADAVSDGRRSLAARAYYARLTQAFVTAVSAPMSEGRLYEVDMRLRPSGRQGPVATSWASFIDYQKNEAWTWEHLALTRARPVAGDMQLGAQAERFRSSLLREKGLVCANYPGILKDVRDMRERLRAAKPDMTAWDAKNGAGYLQDIELCAQTAALMAGAAARDVAGQLRAGCQIGWLTCDQRQSLIDSHALFWCLQSATKLLSDQALDLDAIGEGGRSFLLANCCADSLEKLEANLYAAANAAATIIDRLMAHVPKVATLEGGKTNG